MKTTNITLESRGAFLLNVYTICLLIGERERGNDDNDDDDDDDLRPSF